METPVISKNILSLETSITPNIHTENKFIDVSPFFHLPQGKAAALLGMRPSTFRWLEASTKRAWPYREVAKIKKELETFAQNFQYATGDSKIEQEQRIEALINELARIIRPVIIRVPNNDKLN